MAVYAQWLSYLVLREILIGRYCYHVHRVGVDTEGQSHHICWPESSGCKQQGWELNPCYPTAQSMILSPAPAALLALLDHHKGRWVHILLCSLRPCAYSHLSGPWKSKAAKNNQSLLAPDLPIHSLGHSYGSGWCAGVGPRAIEPRWVRRGVSSLQLQMPVGRRHQVNR